MQKEGCNKDTKEERIRWIHEWKKRNPDKVKAQRLRYLRKHRDKVNEKQRVYRNAHSQRYAEYKWKSTYGVTKQEYYRRFVAQNGKCAICGQVSKRRLCIDHNHFTDKIRGLLCFNCNLGIGYFKDNEQLLLNAIDYLRGVPCYH